jgi:hypothetical protein
MAFSRDNQYETLSALIQRVKGDYEDRVAEHFAAALYPHAYRFSAALAACESPIEQLFAVSLFNFMEWYGYKYGAAEELTVHQQEVVKGLPKPYRVDFLLETTTYEMAPDDPRADRNGLVEVVYSQVVVECDGHDFHERTKEQAQRDKARDRAFHAAGYTVLRFTGSEIWKDPDKCAVEALRMVGEQTRKAKERGM